MSEITFPVLNVKMVDIDKVIANDYNPNKVAPPGLVTNKSLSLSKSGILVTNPKTSIFFSGFFTVKLLKSFSFLPVTIVI